MSTARPELTNIKKEKDSHGYMLNRIQHELEARKKLKSEEEHLAVVKTELFNQFAESEQKLHALPEVLKSITKSIDQLKDTFMGSNERMIYKEVPSRVYNLEKPLYVFYRQLQGYADLYDSSLILDIVESRPLNNLEGAEEPARKRMKMSNASSGEEGKVDPFKPSELAVQVTVKVDATMTQRLCFQYYPHIGTVAVEAAGSEDPVLLSNLFPGDGGEDVPSVTGKYALLASGVNEWPSSASFRPYYWSQWLCGILTLPDPKGNKATPIEPSISAAMNKIRSRLRSYSDLRVQLHALPSEIKADAATKASLFPSTKPATVLSSWRQGGSAKSNSRNFEATFQRGKISVKAEVTIEAEYPTVAPLFKLSRLSAKTEGPSDLDILLNHVEVEVNSHYDELLGSSESSCNYLLSHQLIRLQMCLDVVTGDTPSRSGKERKPALVYDVSTGSYKHRE